ncbi:hypothetical protein CEXT_323651 [Caerostris extrusa]|uniref:Uncharacterized protein n=1 Tax=Caerostris extrusa TaxID=172846 RepID=A0AAV4VH93_CAEEX|nr:hypothetical protein CEXT_323651 [Caerostris extrusa]
MLLKNVPSDLLGNNYFGRLTQGGNLSVEKTSHWHHYKERLSIELTHWLKDLDIKFTTEWFTLVLHNESGEATFQEKRIS